MNHARAVEIAKAHKPKLVADPINDKIPDCLVVRKDKDDHPFSIHIPTETEQDEGSAEREEARLKDSLDAAEAHLA